MECFFGSNGITAVAQFLTNKATPSGRLSSMWYANRETNPTCANFGDYNTGDTTLPYVFYQEGIYMGYRYAKQDMRIMF